MIKISQEFLESATYIFCWFSLTISTACLFSTWVCHTSRKCSLTYNEWQEIHQWFSQYMGYGNARKEWEGGQHYWETQENFWKWCLCSLFWLWNWLQRCIHILKLVKLFALCSYLYVNYTSLKWFSKSWLHRYQNLNDRSSIW